MRKNFSSINYEGLISCAKGEMFGEGNPQLPMPPMLMIDRITEISSDGGNNEKGHVIAELDIDPDTLVIHIRTGDIFYNDWHSLYSQNPLSYYLKISEDFKNVLVVTGKEINNPVINLLKRYKKFTFQSSSFVEDFNTLLNAKNLATSGVSGFPLSAALMSQKLENFYHSDLYQKEHLNPDMLRKDLVNINSYKIIDYVPLGKFVKNEENLLKLIDDDISKVVKV